MVGRHHQPPPIACSYSANGRSSAGGCIAAAGSASCVGRARPGDAMIVRRLDHPLPAAGDLGMRGNLGAVVLDRHAPATGNHRHPLADQPPRHAVAVGVQLDAAFRADHPHQFAHLLERRTAVQRTQRGGFVALKADARRLLGRAVAPQVGHLARPAHQMRLQRRPTVEAVAGQRVALHVFDAALVLALGPRPIRRAGARGEVPVPGKRLRAAR